jgi:Xaa-Pro dipeptidase
MLTVEGCRSRQKRLLQALSKTGLDTALICKREHVYYFTGFRCHWNHATAAIITSKKATLVGWNISGREDLAADERIDYPAHSKFGTMITDHASSAAERLATAVGKLRHVAADTEGPGAFAHALGAALTPINAHILQLRRRKDSDEIACIKAAIEISEGMYRYTKSALRPGKDELELYTELRANAVKQSGVELEAFGNDFRAAAGGGAPRRRAMQAGELYVLDAGPSLHGYHADNCRTFAVDGKGTDVQHAACRKLIDCIAHVEKLVKPGVTALSLFQAAKEFLTEIHGGLNHHLGHGIGLQPHEAPQLNPDFNAVMEVGDVFTMEPGVYSPQLNAGIRLEQNYLLAETGLQRLTSFPLELV